MRTVFCEDAAQLAKLDGFRGELSQLEHAIVLDGEAGGAIGLAERATVHVERCLQARAVLWINP